MINDKTVLAIIPARGGSKRLPRKNVLPFAGKPLIVWTIEAGLKSRYIDKVIVTSDDDEIQKISLEAGSKIIKRPHKLAKDNTNLNNVIKHAINIFEEQYDIVMVLQPTSPLRKAEDIDHALEIMDQVKAPAVISVCKANKPLNWHFSVQANGTLKHILQNKIISDREEYESTYIPNGALYISKTEYFKSTNTFYNDLTIAYIMSQEKSVDIDSQFDFAIAETLID